MSLGQGDVLLTPLQIANGYATLANGGTRFEPRVAMRVLSGETGEEVRRIEPVRATTVELPPEVRNPLVEGMVGVTSREGGTAYGSFLGFPNDVWPVAGKTGTSQVRGRKDFALFAAFGPLHDPQYAISVVMEEAGFGGAHAAPVARRILDVLSGNVPLPPRSTPRASRRSTRSRTRPPPASASPTDPWPPPTPPPAVPPRAPSGPCGATRPRRGATSTSCCWARCWRSPRWGA
jgi:penicillin-binding protein 2